MAEIKVRKLAENINVSNLYDSKFKTMRISMNIIVPLTEEYASANSLLPGSVTRVTKEYPDYRSLSRYLSSLYGASLYSDVMKIGDNQILNVSASGISNRYAFGGENLSVKLSELICSAVFDPLITDDCFFPEDSLKQEKRQMLEILDSIKNDKRALARKKCLEHFYEGEAAVISRYGKRERLKNVNHSDLIEAWVKIMREARIEILVLGDCDFNAVCRIFSSYLDFDREPVHLSTRIALAPLGRKEITETAESSQSKIVMGFRTGVTQEDSLATKVMSVLFGASPMSKLFVNVREKLGLCYYCDATLNDLKGSMLVESGVKTENIDAAVKAIENTLEEIKEGKFTENDLKYAKLAMINGCESVGDSLSALEGWYLGQIFNLEVLSPEEMVDRISDITRIDVIEAARKVQLDTLFVLKGEKSHA